MKHKVEIFCSKRFFYSFQVHGDAGADGGGSTTAVPNVFFTASGFNITYHYFQIFGTQDPTICEVFFTLESEQVGQLKKNISKHI